MLFRNDDAYLRLDIAGYELAADAGDPTSDDRNWLTIRATWNNGEGLLIKDTNSCLLTYELQELTAGLKVVKAGLKQRYESQFTEPFFMLSAEAAGEAFRLFVSFALPNTMEDEDVAELYAVMSAEELGALIAELDTACRKFPDRI